MSFQLCIRKLLRGIAENDDLGKLFFAHEISELLAIYYLLNISMCCRKGICIKNDTSFNSAE